MDLVIKHGNFDIGCVSIKGGKNSNIHKLIYNLDTISLIGISFEIDKSNLVNQSKKYVFIDIDKSAVKDTLLLIDSYLKDKYRIYEPYIKNSIIKVRKHKNYTVETGEKLYISINNIRTKGILSKVQLFTI